MLMSSPDSLSRLVNLYLLLINTKTPLTLAEITEQVGGFSGSFEARRQAFERAKRDLRSLGLPILTTRNYQVNADAYYVDKPNQAKLAPSLSLDEALSLAGAMACVRFGSETALDSARKLGCVFDGEQVELASVPRVPEVVSLFQATNTKKIVEFVYRDLPRRLCPYGIVYRWGNWYLIGKETSSETVKSFRADLMQSQVRLTEDACVPLEGFSISSAIPNKRASIGDPELTVVKLGFATQLLTIVQDRFPAFENVEEFDDQMTCDVSVGGFQAFMSAILDFGKEITVLGPPEIRSRIGAQIDVAIEAQRGVIQEIPGFESRIDLSNYAHDLDSFGETSRRRNEPVVTQFRRVMALLPWLQRNPTTTTGEIARLFDIDEGAVGSLLERVACCGLPPFSPEKLIDIIVDGEMIYSEISDRFAAGLRLDYNDLFVIALSAKLVLTTGNFEGREHLVSAIDSIFSSFDVSLDLEESIVIDLEGQRNFADLRDAINLRVQVSFSYFSGSRHELTRRVVDPYLLFSAGEFWYLRGWCHNSGDVRVFRLDRIDQVDVLTSEIQVTPTAHDLIVSTFTLEGEDFANGTLTAIICAPSERWRIAYVPHVIIDDALEDRAQLIMINVVSIAWLVNLVASSGGKVTVALPLEQVETCLIELEEIRTRFK